MKFQTFFFLVIMKEKKQNEKNNKSEIYGLIEFLKFFTLKWGNKDLRVKKK